MVIIFGAADLGKHIAKEFFSNQNDVVYYDNDRRKWGKTIDGIEVIELQRFLELVHEKDTKIIIGNENDTALFFLKDVCVPENEILKVEGDVLVSFNLKTIGEFKRDIQRIEKDKLKKYEEARDQYKKNGNSAAFDHAVEYIEWKRQNLSAPEIGGIELTNNCNLRCPNCPTPTSKYPKGFMSDEVFEMAYKMIPPHPQTVFSLHGLGEPLLHPKFISYLEKVAELDVHIMISTNGILLDENMASKIFNVFDRVHGATLYISFHLQRSVENWFRCLNMAQERTHIQFYGQVLEHNAEQAEKWLSQIGVRNPRENSYIRYITSHSFAGHVPGRKSSYSGIELVNRIRNCTYLKNNEVSVAWNGVLKTCCYDSEPTGECGTIFEMEKARINPEGYKLCENCDPDWTSNYQ